MVWRSHLSGALFCNWVLWLLLGCCHAMNRPPGRVPTLPSNKTTDGNSNNVTLRDPVDVLEALPCHFEGCSQRCWKENGFDPPKFALTFRGDGSSADNETDVSEHSSESPLLSGQEGLYQCHCDDKCIIYGDCCYDFLSECHGTNMSILFSNVSDWNDVYMITKNLMNDVSSFDAKMSILMFRSCQEIEGSDDETHYYWMISNCPLNANIGVADKCTSNIGTPLNSSPVTLKQNPEVIFRNIYCGICHGFQVKDVLRWSTKAVCFGTSPNSYSNLLEKLKYGTCTIQSEPTKETKVRTCNKYGVDRCSQNEQYVDPNVLMCRSYEHMVFDEDGELYRNPHVLVRQQHLNENLTCTDIKTMNFNARSASTGSSAFKGDGLSILFNFNEQGVKFESNQIIMPTRDCKVDEVFDHYYDICRKLHCQGGNVAVNGSCIFNGTQIVTNYFVPYHVTPDHFYLNFSVNFENDTMIGSKSKFHVTNISFGADFITDLNILVTNISTNTLCKENNSTVHNLYPRTDFSIEIMTDSNLTLTTLVHAISQVNELFSNKSSTHLRTITDVFLSNLYLQNFTCSQGTAITLQNASLTTNSGIMYAHDSDTLYPLERIGFVLEYNNMTAVLSEAIVCGIPLNCDFNILNRSDFELDNLKLKAIHTDLVLEEDTFFIQEEKVYACNTFNHSRTRRHIQTFFKYDHMQGILSHVTSGVSLVSLFITLVVYSMLPELRNLPGRLIMSLSASLLVSQTLLLLIRLPTGVLCQALAIALHFSWLCSFMWMTVMSFSVADTFQSKSKQALAQRTNKTYTLFSLFAFGIPVVIVGVSVLIDVLDVPGIVIGYGVSGACWISNPTASLLIFGLPVGLSIVANTIFFVVTYYNIDKSLRLSKNVTSTGKDKCRILIYSKLFIIMGVTWGFSFIAGFADVRSLWYIFIIMNGLQGFYILFSFICTDRVKLMLRQKFAGKESQHDMTSTVYTSTSTKT